MRLLNESKAMLGLLSGVALIVVSCNQRPATEPVAQDLIEGKDPTQPPSLPKPQRGVPFTDPVYGTTVVRATDHAADGVVGFARNDYSRRQAFNADDTRFLVSSHNGYWHLYDANTYQHIKQLSGPAGDAEPQWHPTDPNKFYFLPNNGGTVIYLYDLTTDTYSTVADFAGRLPWPDVAHIWTRAEGSPSADGRYWGFMAEAPDGPDEGGSFDIRGFFTYDLQEDRILAVKSASARPDHVSMSASGDYFVVSWNDTGVPLETGTVAFTRELARVQTLHHKSVHSDLALDASGDDIYVAVDYQTNDGNVYMQNLRTGEKATLFTLYEDGAGSAIHFSGKSFDKPGWVLVSTYASQGPWQWYMEKVFAVELREDPRIYNIAHHHAFEWRREGVEGSWYFTEPHASVNRDFTRILFNSNWEQNTELDVDAYMVRLNQGDVPDVGDPPPDAGSPPPDAGNPPPDAGTCSGQATLQVGVNGYAGGKDQSHFKEVSFNARHYGAGQAETYYLRANGAATNALIYFDLAGQVPSGAIIDSAALSLYDTGSGSFAGGTVDLYRVTDPDGKGMWIEGSSSDYTQKDGAAWSRRAGSGNTVSTGWTDTSGSTIMDSVVSTASGTITLTPGAGWNESSDLAADVQAWVDDPVTNQGWYLRVRSGSDINIQNVASHQHETASERPKLTITYHGP